MRFIIFRESGNKGGSLHFVLTEVRYGFTNFSEGEVPGQDMLERGTIWAAGG